MPPTKFLCVLGTSAGTNAVHSLSSLAAAFYSRRRVARKPLATLLVLLVLGAALAARAQSALFVGALQPIGNSAVTEPIAIDAQGNVWIPNPTSQELLEYTAVNGVVPLNSTPVAVAQGKFVEPSGIAFDSAGDLFVTDRSQNTIYELVAVSGSIPASPTIKTISTSSSLNNPWGLAFDGKGNLWVANFIGSSVLELQAVSGMVPVNPGIVTYSGVSSSGTGGGGFQYPQGVWVDASGDVFVADTSNNAIKEMVAVSGSVPAPTASTPTINQLGSGFSGPTGVAVDSSGNVWVADYGNSELKEMLAVGGSIPSSPTILNLTGTTGGNINTFGVAVDAHNNVYAEQYNAIASESLLLELGPGNFGQVYLGKGPTSGSTTSQSMTLEFGFLKYLETNAPAVYTQGVANLDYTDAGSGTCDTNGAHPAYNAGNTCTLNVVFTPLYPGTRLGAAQLYDDDGDLIASGPLGGDGVGPLATFVAQKGTAQVTNLLPSGYTEGVGCIAVDASGNIYYAILFGSLYELPWNGASYGAPVNIGAGFTFGPKILGCAVDGAGNVFVGDPYNQQIVEIPRKGSGFGTPFQALNTSALYNTPTNIAIDGAGNIYFSSYYSEYADEAPHTANGYSSYVQLPFTSLITAYGIAVDAAGDVFTTNESRGTILELPATPTGFGAQVTVASGLSNIGPGLQIDPAGDLYYATVNGAPVELAWNGTSYNAPAQVYQNVTPALDPNDIVLDSRGNMFEADAEIRILEMDRADPPSLSFANTSVGQTSTDSPQIVLAANIGNAPLMLSATAYPTDFPEGSGQTPLCASGSNLTLGVNCYIAVNFTPTTLGLLNEDVAIQDNDLFGSGGATQNIAVSGTGTGGPPAPTISWTPASPIAYGTTLSSAQFNAAAFASSTNVSSDGTFAYYVGTVGGTPATTSTVLPVGNDQICVQWTPSSSYTSTYNSSSLCVSITVNAATPSISWTPSSTTIIQATGPTSGQFDATAMLNSNNVTADGTLTYYLTNVGGTVVNVGTTTLPLGNNSICVQWTPSSTYTSDYNSVSTCQSFTVMNTPTPTINWTPATPITYGTTLGSGDFSASVTYSSNNVSADGTFAYYVGTVGGTAATSSTILPGGSNQLCVQWTPSSSYASQYTSTSECLPIQVNAASTSISWTPSSTTIIAATGPTSAQLDAAAFAGSNNVTGNGTVTYFLSTVGGTAITVGSSLALGPATICVQWTPSSSYAADYNSTSTCLSGFNVINTQPTTTVVTSNANPVFSTYSVTFTATVTPTSGTIVPTGTVTFYDNGTQIGTGSLSPSGTGASAIARFTTTSLAIGTHPITASYGGDTNNQASPISTALPEVVEDFSVTANAPTSNTIEPGTSTTFTFTVSPVSPATTFPAAITLTVSGLPTGATASFSPSSINSGAGSTSVTLTVTTPTTTLARNAPPGSAPAPKWPLMAVALLLLPMAGKLRRAGRGLSRMLSLLLLVAAGISAAAALNGCGGTPTGYFGQAPATSSITVTGTSGSLNHNASVSLTVE